MVLFERVIDECLSGVVSLCCMTTNPLGKLKVSFLYESWFFVHSFIMKGQFEEIWKSIHRVALGSNRTNLQSGGYIKVSFIVWSICTMSNMFDNFSGSFFVVFKQEILTAFSLGHFVRF